jgi:hypothetical protein
VQMQALLTRGLPKRSDNNGRVSLVKANGSIARRMIILVSVL